MAGFETDLEQLTRRPDPLRRGVAPYALLLGATIVLGLATRAMPSVFPDVMATYGGDVLWAAMVVWILALMRPSAEPRRLGVLALGVATTVEVSQLYQAPWINAVRSTRIGALALGQGFLLSDLLCYAIGVTLAVIVDVHITRRLDPRTAL